MRHNVYGKKLGRNKDERDVLFKSLVHHLFSHGTIETTESKAKAIKGLVDHIITLAKNKTSRRLIQSYIANKSLQSRLVDDILPKVSNRISGYTSLVKLGRRLGDNTMMVRMSLIGAEKMEALKKEVPVKIKALKSTAQLSMKVSSKDAKPAKSVKSTTNKTVKKV